jgi:hypothetical protein
MSAMKLVNVMRLRKSSATLTAGLTRTYTVSMRMCERLSSAAEKPQALAMARA